MINWKIIEAIGVVSLGVPIGWYLADLQSNVPQKCVESVAKSEDLTARRIVSTVTKYITKPGAQHWVSLPIVKTRTIIDKPHEVTHEHQTPILPTPYRYSLGLGFSSLNPTRADTEVYGAVRLGNWPISLYTTITPSLRVTGGVRYDF